MFVRSDNYAKLTEVVTSMLLEGDNLFLEALRNQFRQSEGIQIELTGEGFSSAFHPAKSLKILNAGFQNKVFLDVDGLDENGVVQVGFQLFITNGSISFLEGFAWLQDEWPKMYIEPMYVHDTTTGYSNSETRDDAVIRNLPSDYLVVTKGMLDEAQGKPLPYWPSLQTV